MEQKFKLTQRGIKWFNDHHPINLDNVPLESLRGRKLFEDSDIYEFPLPWISEKMTVRYDYLLYPEDVEECE